MPTPYRRQVQDQIWTLLQAHPAVTDKDNGGAAVLIKPPGEVAAKAQIIRRGVSEYPQVIINRGRTTSSAFTQPAKPTFKMEQASSVAGFGDYILQKRVEYLIVIIGRDPGADLDALVQAIEDALDKGGPRLGLPSLVLNYGPITITPPKVVTNNGQQRLQVAMSVPVNLQFSGTAYQAAIPSP